MFTKPFEDIDNDFTKHGCYIIVIIKLITCDN